LQHIDSETRHQQQSVDSNKKLSTWNRYTRTGSYPYPHGCGCGYDFCNPRETLTLVSGSGFLRVRVRVCRKHTRYKPLPIPTGRGFGGYGYGYSQKYPRVTRAHHYLPLHEIDIHISGKVIKAGVIDSGSRISLAATLRSQFRTQQTHPSVSLSPPVHGSGSTRSSNYVNSCASTESPRQWPLVHKPSRSTAHSSLLS
jgi:hypothetical protein